MHLEYTYIIVLLWESKNVGKQSVKDIIYLLLILFVLIKKMW